MEMGVKGKLGKLGMIGNTYDNGEISYFVREMNCVVEKVNEIIDHINQDQPEETEHAKAHKKYLDLLGEGKGEDWRKRLGSYDSWASNESMFITIDGETIYVIEDLIDFIQKEIEKAEERGYEKGVGNQAKLDRELYGMSFEEIKKKYPKEV